MQSRNSSSREYAVTMPLYTYQEYSGEILQFTAETIELRYRRHGSSKYDVLALHLSDPRIRIIYGDPSGGPGLVVLQDDAPIEYNDDRNPIRGTLSPGPHGLTCVTRHGAPTVFVRSQNMRVINEDNTGSNTPAERRRLFARGELGERFSSSPAGKTAVLRGKAMPQGKGRPASGTPAKAMADAGWD